ncbi:hypothetical protein NQZ68_018462 [Dissostichus eleginoides]|nr:hypothetical protein NQZ68_018462 [Dissostichus eleginoides]
MDAVGVIPAVLADDRVFPPRIPATRIKRCVLARPEPRARENHSVVFPRGKFETGARGRMKPAHRVGLPNGRRAQAGECVSELRSGAPAGGKPRRSGSVPGTTGVPCKQ